MSASENSALIVGADTHGWWFRSSKYHGVVVDAYPRDTFADFLKRPNDLFCRSFAERLPSHHTTSVAAFTMNVAGARRRLVVKRWNRKRPTETPDVQRHVWQTSHALVELGIPTATPVAMLERVCSPKARPTFFISEEIEGAQSLDVFAKLRFISADLRREVVTALAQLMARTHGLGVCHRDVKERNVLVRSDGRRIELFLVDLDEVRTSVPQHSEQLLRSLARCTLGLMLLPGVRRADVTLFLDEYAHSAIGSSPDGPALLERIREIVPREWPKYNAVTKELLTG